MINGHRRAGKFRCGISRTSLFPDTALSDAAFDGNTVCSHFESGDLTIFKGISVRLLCLRLFCSVVGTASEHPTKINGRKRSILKEQNRDRHQSLVRHSFLIIPKEK